MSADDPAVEAALTAQSVSVAALLMVQELILLIAREQDDPDVWLKALAQRVSFRLDHLTEGGESTMLAAARLTAENAFASLAVFLR